METNEIVIPEDATFDEAVEAVNQWNEENPEDCHSPYMGILDEQFSNEVEVNSESEENTEVYTESTETEVVDIYYTSPKTMDTDITYILCLIIILGCLLGIFATTKAKERFYG